MLFESFFDTLESAALVISSDLGTPSSVRHGYSRIDDDDEESKKKTDEKTADDSEKVEDPDSKKEEAADVGKVTDEPTDDNEKSDVDSKKTDEETSVNSNEVDLIKLLSGKFDSDVADKDKIFQLIDTIKTAFPEDLKNLEDLLGSLDVRISISSDGIEVKNIRRKSNSSKDNK